MTLDAQRRYMLLDAVLVPGLGGRSIASVCANELDRHRRQQPRAPGRARPAARPDPGGQRRGPAGVPAACLRDAAVAAAARQRADPRRPRRGGCRRVQRLRDDRRHPLLALDARTASSSCPQILPIGTETARRHPSPTSRRRRCRRRSCTIQNAPAVPDPAGLSSAFGLLSTPGLFRDVTGLEGTQAQRRRRVPGLALGGVGPGRPGCATRHPAGARHATPALHPRPDRPGAERRARSRPAAAQELTNSALGGLTGEPGAGCHSADQRPGDRGQSSTRRRSRPGRTSSRRRRATRPSMSSFDDDQPVARRGAARRTGARAARAGARRGAERRRRHLRGARPLLWDDDLRDRRVARACSRATPSTRRASSSSGGSASSTPPTPASPCRWRGRAGSRWSCSSTAIIRAGRPTGSIPNLDGYAYLQDELARHGIISVSVDTNAATALGSLIDMRADMVLGAFDSLRALDADPTSPLFGRLDFETVGLMGHGSGGDAVLRGGAASTADACPRSGSASRRSACWGPRTCAPDAVTRVHTPFLGVVYGGLDGDVDRCGRALLSTGIGRDRVPRLRPGRLRQGDGLHRARRTQPVQLGVGRRTRRPAARSGGSGPPAHRGRSPGARQRSTSAACSAGGCSATSSPVASSTAPAPTASVPKCRCSGRSAGARGARRHGSAPPRAGRADPRVVAPRSRLSRRR